MHCFLLFVELFNEKNPPSLSKSQPRRQTSGAFHSLPHLTSSALSRNSGNTHTQNIRLWYLRCQNFFHTKTIQWLTFFPCLFSSLRDSKCIRPFFEVFRNDYLIKPFGRHFHSDAIFIPPTNSGHLLNRIFFRGLEFPASDCKAQ